MWMTQNLRRNVSGSHKNPEAPAAEGRLYNWNAALAACPTGWKLPSDYEWQVLVNAYGGDNIAGLYLGYGGGSKFDPLMAGWCDMTGNYKYRGARTAFWSNGTDHNNNGMAWDRHLLHEDVVVYHGTFNKLYGLSVRCILDE